MAGWGWVLAAPVLAGRAPHLAVLVRDGGHQIRSEEDQFPVRKTRVVRPIRRHSGPVLQFTFPHDAYDLDVTPARIRSSGHEIGVTANFAEIVIDGRTVTVGATGTSVLHFVDGLVATVFT